MTEYFWSKPFNDEWLQMLSINLYATEVEVYEWMQTMENEEIHGRTLTIENTSAFLRSYNVKSERDFEDLMDNKNDSGILELDHIHRHCERHGLIYKIEGMTLGAARRKYHAEVKAIEQAEKEHAFELYRKGSDILDGRNGEAKDIDTGLRLLEQSIQCGCMCAYGKLALYYLVELKRGMAIQTALAGAKNGDPISMYVLSVLYRDGADFENLTDLPTGQPDMEKAVEWCLKSARAGNFRAIRDLNKYIHSGFLIPDTKLYLEILVLQAKLNSIAQR